ncbi:MAG TPA: V-type ATPase subunit [Nitrospiria bacterium]
MTDLYYMNSRIRSMMGERLTRSDYEAVLNTPDIPALEVFLRETPYGPSIEAIPDTNNPSGRIEKGLRLNLSQTLGRLCRLARGDPEAAVKMVLSFWNLANLKTIIRGRLSGLSSPQIMANLVPTGLYDEPALEAICRQPDLRAIADLLVSWGDRSGRVIRKASTVLRDARDLVWIENDLDRFNYAESRKIIESPAVPKSARPFLRKFLCNQVDRTNLLTAFKLVETGVGTSDPVDYYLEGGRLLPRQEYIRLCGFRNLPDAILESARPVSLRSLREVSPEASGFSRLAIAERRLDRWMLEGIRLAARIDPLGMATVVFYLFEKVRELSNIRMILRARLIGLPDVEVSPLLIMEY